MSVLIAKIRGALALCALVPLLAACLETGSTPQQVVLADGTVQVTAPAGYCVDSRASGDEFVLLASCASVTRRASAPHPAAPALLTVTVTPHLPGDLPIKSQYARLKAYFKSDQGRANLSQNGDPAQVRVIRTSMTNGVFIVQARDNSAEMPRGQWRAIFDLGDYVVSATVTALQDQPISDDAGGATLEALIARIVTTKAASE